MSTSSRSQPLVWSAFLFHLFCIPISIFTLLTVSGCAAPIVAIGGTLGSTSTAAASSAGTIAVSAAVANPSTAASAVSTVTTGKSPLEHAASAATKQDCNFLNAFGSKPICSDVRFPQIKDMSEPYLGPADLNAPLKQN